MGTAPTTFLHGSQHNVLLRDKSRGTDCPPMPSPYGRFDIAKFPLKQFNSLLVQAFKGVNERQENSTAAPQPSPNNSPLYNGYVLFKELKTRDVSRTIPALPVPRYVSVQSFCATQC